MSERKISRFARRAVRVEEARQRLLNFVKPLDTETVAIDEALGRRLSEPFHAPADIPHFRRSGMDGFAVRSDDVAAATPQVPVVLRIVGESPAGCTAPPRVEPGTAVRTMTGAVVPEGADAVVMFEQTDELEHHASQPADRSFVKVKHAAKPGQNVGLPGEDFRVGDPLFSAGEWIGPGHLAVFATFGIDGIAVYRKPVVGLLATGNEFADNDEPLAPGQIRNSNIPMLAAQIALSCGIPKRIGIAGDDPEEIRSILQEAIAECDLIVTSGGVSVGDYDAIAALLRGLNTDHETGQVLFDRVAMRPGAPTSAAIIDDKLLIALSGNPGACFVGCELFVRPVLSAMQGVRFDDPSIQAVVDEDYWKGSPFDRYERAQLYEREGVLRVRACGFSKSSMMRTLPEANALMVIPSGSKGIARGETIRVIPLHHGSL